ncbi:hypothetical protein [Micromonospora tarensis]|uniref:Uncharacterized protein n=1 Tax=Micromonospora tarensis TaxID=2806100 RepID=A0ABS1YCE9_9ACTN|nr:hypothetical protein [Micromonospora tarensis]MBM0275078.1 hypothetical protein [Micromonospora tarensis]
MTTIHQIRGKVPADSPLRALAGKTVTAPAGTPSEVAARVTEMRLARIDPVILAARHIPWTPIVLAGAGAVLVDVAVILAAILGGHNLIAWTAAGVGLVLGLLLLVACIHLQMDR